MALKVLQSIMPNMSLSLPLNQRTAKGREKAAAKLSEEFRKLIAKVPRQELTTEKYREIVYSLIPSIKPPINIEQIGDEQFLGAFQSTGLCNRLNDDNYLFVHSAYKVKFNLQGDRIISDKNTIVHETRHLFDTICSPKRAMRRNLAYAADADVCSRIDEIYQVVKIPQGAMKKDFLREKLHGLDAEIVVGILQSLRNSLKSEVNAYREEFLFAVQQKSNFLEKLMLRIGYYLSFMPDFEMQKRLNIITGELKKVLRSRHNS